MNLRSISENDPLFLQRLLKSGGFDCGPLDGICGNLTEAATHEFENFSDSVAANSDTFDERTESNLRTLQPKTQEAARVFLKKVRDAGINAKITSGTRTYAEQNALYKKGRYGNPGPRVTNARGGESYHNFGIAWDITIFDESDNPVYDSPLYNQAAARGLEEGLEWGGGWSGFPDLGHYQMVTGYSLAEIRARFENGKPYSVEATTVPVAQPAWTESYGGLQSDQFVIPHQGIENQTLLKTFGVKIEPLGTVVDYLGQEFIKGKCSSFGGPGDTGVGPMETAALTGEILHDLPEDDYYVAMRWDYQGQKDFWINRHLLIINPANDHAVVVRAIDWGPNPSTNRIVDLSPKAMEALKVNTDDELLCAFSTPSNDTQGVGPVKLA